MAFRLTPKSFMTSDNYHGKAREEGSGTVPGKTQVSSGTYGVSRTSGTLKLLEIGRSLHKEPVGPPLPNLRGLWSPRLMTGIDLRLVWG